MKKIPFLMDLGIKVQYFGGDEDYTLSHIGGNRSCECSSPFRF